MGRAGRKSAPSVEPRGHWSETHPDRHLWTDAQRVHARMQTQEEYEALYGRATAPSVREPQVIRSPFLREGAIAPELLENISSSRELRDFLQEHIRSTPEDIATDPLFEALWKAEWSRITQQLEDMKEDPELASAAIYHWAEPYTTGELDPEHLRHMWMTKILPTFLERDYSTNKPHSLLSAYLEANGTTFGRNIVANMIRVMRSDADDKYHQFFEEEVMPEAEHLGSPVHRAQEEYTLPTAQLSLELWEGLRQDPIEYGSDLQSHSNKIARIIELGGGNAQEFRNNPLLSASSTWRRHYFSEVSGAYPGTTLFAEAMLELDWELVQSGSRENAMKNVANLLLRQQLVRVASGLGREDTERPSPWPAYAQGLLDNAVVESPLEALRPIFRGENQEELLDRVQKIVDEEIIKSASKSSAGSANPGYLHTFLYMTDDVNLEALDQGETLSEQMLRSLERAASQGYLQ